MQFPLLRQAALCNGGISKKKKKRKKKNNQYANLHSELLSCVHNGDTTQNAAAAAALPQPSCFLLLKALSPHTSSPVQT